MDKVECVAPTGCVLGKAPLWSPSDGFLWWTDAHRAKLHRYNPRTMNTRRYDLPLHASAMTINKGSIIMAGDRELGTYDTETEAYERRFTLDAEPENNRVNAGGMAPNGSFWFATMDAGEEALSGSIYCLSSTGELETTRIDPVRAPNAFCFAPDGETFYFSDTAEQEILAFDHDPQTGVLTDRRVFASTATAGNYPQGSAIDSEGYLWNAQWAGSRVVRYAPDGSIDRVLELPVSRPTDCVFGGEDLKRLFITTARAGLGGRALDRQPMAGCLFAIDVEVAGHPIPEWTGTY